MAIKIYTDASSNLFESILRKKNLDITVLPMRVEIDDQSYLCYEDKIDVQEFSKTFYEKMLEGHRPKTSLPNPGLFQEKMEEEISKGNRVLYISLAGGISGTYQTCSMIAKQINEAHKGDYVRVVNSKTAGLGEGMICMKAYELSKNTDDLDALVSQVEECVKCTRSEFVVDSLIYLTNSGRISKLTAKVASILSLKPLLYGSDEGKIELTSIARGQIKALKKLASQAIENIKDKAGTVYISHCNNLEGASHLKDFLHAGGIDNVEIYFYDLVTGAHVGPGTVALFYEGNNRKI